MITGRYKYLFLSTVAAVVVIIDQAVKRWVVYHFVHQCMERLGNSPVCTSGESSYSSNTVIPNLFDLILTRNPGAAWGMLGTLRPDGLRVAVFICISIGAVAMVLWIARKAKPHQSLLVIALSLVLGGALGNLVDRIVAGKVVDFLDFYTRAPWFMRLAAALHQTCDPVHGCHWPAFNVADMCISTGVILLILETFITGRHDKRVKEAALAAAPATPTPLNGAAPPEPPQAPPAPIGEGGSSS